jgi:serine/threonine protein kinase
LSRTCPECSTRYEEDVLHCPEDGRNLTDVEPDDDLIGRSLGSYTIVKLLGKGGMGAVYMGEHPVIGSRVAIKFLHPQFSGDKKIVDRFFNEARAVNLIGHDNILKIIDLNVTEDNRHYFIMEFLHGHPLQDLVEPDKPLPFALVGPIVLQCCEALQAAHERGIVHRDLKPDNVYLIIHKGRKNFVKLVDFGIAKLTDPSGQTTGKTQTGMVMGTPAYMSPEQAGGLTNRIDARSDVYSLGVMMFQMATGKLPFPGQSFGEVLIGHLQLPPPRPRELHPGIPEQFEALVLKCLEKKQEDRYQSMQQVAEALRASMAELGLSTELPVALPSDLPKAISSSNPGGARLTPTRKLTPRPPSQPGTRTRAEVTSSRAAVSVPPAAARARSPMPFLVAGIAAAVAVLAVGGSLVYDSSRRAAAATQKAADLAAQKAKEQADVEVRLAKEKAQESAATIFLSVISDPLGAEVQATWKNGARSGTTPFSLEVAKNSKIHLEFRKSSFLPYTTEIVADAPQVVSGKLTPEPKVVAASPVPISRRKRAQAPKPDEDGTIHVDF